MLFLEVFGVVVFDIGFYEVYLCCTNFEIRFYNKLNFISYRVLINKIHTQSFPSIFNFLSF